MYRLISLIGPHCPESTYSSTYPFPGAHFVAARKKKRERRHREEPAKRGEEEEEEEGEKKDACVLVENGEIISCEKK